MFYDIPEEAFPLMKEYFDLFGEGYPAAMSRATSPEAFIVEIKECIHNGKTWEELNPGWDADNILY